MIELTVRQYLLSRLNLPVFLEVPAVLHERFLVVEKTGSSEKNYIQSAHIAVQSYGQSMEECLELNEQVKTAMRGLSALPKVTACRLERDYNFTDTSARRYRYQAIFLITYYA